MIIYSVDNSSPPKISTVWSKTGSTHEIHTYYFSSQRDAEDFQSLVALDGDVTLRSIQTTEQAENNEWLVKVIWRTDKAAANDAARKTLSNAGIKIGVTT